MRHWRTHLSIIDSGVGANGACLRHHDWTRLREACDDWHFQASPWFLPLQRFITSEHYYYPAHY